MFGCSQALADDPDMNHFQPTEEDPSRYWIGMDGDVIVTFTLSSE